MEDGVFEVVFHHVHKHQHETTPCSSLIKDFLAKFKAECGEKLDVPVQRIFEDLKISFVSNLDATQKSKLIEALPSMRAALMVGYRARGKDFSNLPQTLAEVDVGERFIQTLTEKDCHLWMGATLCEILSQGQKMWIDGTFFSASKPFKQTLITRTKVNGEAFTTSYSLLPNKEKTTYLSALQQIKDTCESEGHLPNMMYVQPQNHH